MKNNLYRYFLQMSLYRYALVGCITAIVDMGLLALLFEFLYFQRQVAVTISYIFGAIVNFILHKYVTFRMPDGYPLKQISRYIIVLGMNYLLTVLITEVGVRFLSFTLVVSKLIAVVITFICGYLMNRIWVFEFNRNRSPEGERNGFIK